MRTLARTMVALATVAILLTSLLAVAGATETKPWDGYTCNTYANHSGNIPDRYDAGFFYEHDYGWFGPIAVPDGGLYYAPPQGRYSWDKVKKCTNPPPTTTTTVVTTTTVPVTTTVPSTTTTVPPTTTTTSTTTTTLPPSTTTTTTTVPPSSTTTTTVPSTTTTSTTLPSTTTTTPTSTTLPPVTSTTITVETTTTTSPPATTTTEPPEELPYTGGELLVATIVGVLFLIGGVVLLRKDAQTTE